MPPVGLTVAELPADTGSLGASAPTGGTESGPSVPDSVTGSTPSPPSATGSDAPAMTVRQDGRHGGGSDVSGAGETSVPTGDSGASGQATATPAGADEADGRVESAQEADRSVERVLGRAMESPAVIDRLYRAIERRRRIERERGGER